MNRLAVSCAVLLMLFQTADVVADDWQDYLKVMGNYYFLDKQKFNSIRCRISASLLDEAIKEIREKVLPTNKRLSLKSDLSEYSLVFNRFSGLQIHDPSIDIELASAEDTAKARDIERGIAQIKLGFTQQVQGIDEELEAVFESYQSVKREDIFLERVVEDHGVYVIAYKKSGLQIRETISGQYIKSSETGFGDEITSEGHYIAGENDNKLAISDLNILIKGNTLNIDTNMSVKYQEIGSTRFPADINGRSALSSSGQVPKNITFDIHLDNCQID